MQPLELRDEFLSKHMRGTAIELRNKQNTGWAQRGPDGACGLVPVAGALHESTDQCIIVSPNAWKCSDMYRSARCQGPTSRIFNAAVFVG